MKEGRTNTQINKREGLPNKPDAVDRDNGD